MNYKQVKKGGYPIGSGGIESSNKTVCHTRLKRSGAWWYVEQANLVGLCPRPRKPCKSLCSEFCKRRTLCFLFCEAVPK